MAANGNGIFQRTIDIYRGTRCSCTGVAVSANGTVYVSDKTNNIVRVFSDINNWERMDSIGQLVGQPGHLPDPQGIAIIGGTIFVADFNAGCIKMFSADDTRYLDEFGANDLDTPRSICTDQDGRLLVADKEGQRIQIFVLNGDQWGRNDTIGCDGRRPYDVAVDPRNKDIHVAFYNEHTIAIYSKNGNPISPNPTYNLGGRLQYPKAICIDSRGIRYIGAGEHSDKPENDRDRVYAVGPNDTLLGDTEVGALRSMTVDQHDKLYVTHWEDTCVIIYIPVDFNN